MSNDSIPELDRKIKFYKRMECFCWIAIGILIFVALLHISVSLLILFRFLL